MHRLSRITAGVAFVAIVATGCSNAAARPGWTFSAPSSGSAASSPAAAPAESAPAAAVRADVIAIDAFDLGFSPATVTVPAAGTYEVAFSNTGAMLHDVTFADGTTLSAAAGETATGTVTLPEDGFTFICSIPGHGDAGMKGEVTVGVDAVMAGMHEAPATSPPAESAAAIAGAPVSDPAAPKYERFDPVAPAVLPGKTHDIDLPIIEKDITVADGFVVHAWTFGGTVPGPTIRVHIGDTVNVHLTNKGEMTHSIDFHASETAMNHQMVEISPGDTFTYTFEASYAGVWMYHCGTAPALHHIANGMFGMVIVEPEGGLPPVDEEFAFVQSEWYLTGQGQPASYEKANQTAAAPDFVVFNGVANQYKDKPIPVTTGGRVRVFVLDAGPSLDSSFHVVGTIFDQVTKEGIQLLRGNAGGWGSQAVDLASAQGAIVEFTPTEDGMYPFVTHAFNLVTHGAIGIFTAGDGDPLH
jgi:nitrite reductase (NO-forming)